jgi:recombination protein RecA
MSSVPLNTIDSAFLNVSTKPTYLLSEALAARFPASPERSLHEKKNRILQQIADSGRVLDVRPASRLEVRPRPEMLSSGIAEVDAITGGIPRGCLSEIYGPASSGKTSVLLAAIAAATRREETCVLIDASDSFDPESAAAARVVFSKLLWVRCGESSSAVSRRSSTSNVSVYDPRPNHGKSSLFKSQRSSERRLEQVLKSTDLVLQSGGFGMVALDLAGIPEKFVRRIPLASWFRFQRAVEHTKTALLVVSEFACAQTCAAVVLKLENKLSAVSSQPSAKPSHAQFLERIQIQAELSRMRLERRPAGSVRTVFSTKAIRTG